MPTMDVVPIPRPIQEVAKLLQRIPGVGEKRALRDALFLASYSDVMALGEALTSLPFAVRPCETCHAITDGDCPYCERTSAVVCVVHQFVDLLAVERAAAFLKMRFFVLGKLVSPLDGISEDDLPMDDLRVMAETAEEIVLALPPSVEGEATSLLVTRALNHTKVTQLARGLPHGGNLEMADVITLRGAFDKRAPTGAP